LLFVISGEAGQQLELIKQLKLRSHALENFVGK